MRAIAILLVVLAHAGVPGLDGGFVGVDIFFVISGYLITGLLYRELQVRGRIDFPRFYARRFKRLLPALLATALMTWFAARTLLSSLEFPEVTRSLPFAVTWSSNFFFALRNIDYFNEFQSRDLFLHTWSLGVEEQFYLLWPIFLFGAHRLCSKRGSPWSGLQLAAPVLILGVGSYLLALWWTYQQPMFAYYLMPARIWQLATGACVFLLSTRAAGVPTPSSQHALKWLGLAALLAAALVISPERPYPGLWALAPVAATAMILAGLSPGSVNPLLSNGLMRWLGDRSYAWYLSHWPVFTLAGLLGVPQTAPASVLLLGLSLAIASAIFQLIEQPFWKGSLSRFAPATTLLGATAAMALFLGGTLALDKDEGDARAIPALGVVRAAVSDRPPFEEKHCDTWYKSAEVAPCQFSGERYTRTLVLMGDSILAQWFSTFRQLYPAPQWRILLFTKSACPMVDEPVFYQRINATYAVCSEWRDQSIELLAQLKPDVIVVGSGVHDKFSEQQWVSGSERIYRRLAQASGSVVAIAGSPGLSFNGPGCLLQKLEGETLDPTTLDGSCSSSAAMPLAGRVAAYLEQAAATVDGVALLDLNDLVCPGGVCSALSPLGEVVYRDSQHLTSTFALSLAPAVRKRLRRLGIPVD